MNFISEIEKRINKRNIIKLAQPYDLKTNDKNNVLNLVNDKNKKISLNTLNFSNFNLHKKIEKIFHKINFNDVELQYHFWTICISIFLIDKFIVNEGTKNKKLNLRKKVEDILIKDLNLLANSIHSSSFENRIKKEIQNVNKIIKNNSNIKCLGSGVNYNLAKFTSNKIMNSLNRACAFDILENHKHIDISAESSVIIFIANIRTPGYQNDAFSEIQKIISHNNLPIIITNVEDNRFNNIRSFDNKKIKLIKIPTLPEICNSFINIFIIGQIIKKLNHEK